MRRTPVVIVAALLACGALADVDLVAKCVREAPPDGYVECMEDAKQARFDENVAAVAEQLDQRQFSDDAEAALLRLSTPAVLSAMEALAEAIESETSAKRDETAAYQSVIAKGVTAYTFQQVSHANVAHTRRVIATQIRLKELLEAVLAEKCAP